MNSYNKADNEKVNEYFSKIKGELNMENLIESCKKIDAKRAKLLKSMIWMYGLLIVFYFGLMIINPDPDISFLERISGGTIILAFMLFAIVFYREFVSIRRTDYSLPISELLIKTEKRYKIWNPSLILVGIGILLIDGGVSIIFLSHSHYMPDWSIEFKIAAIQVIYFAVLLISGFIGFIDWKKKYKPLLDNIRMLKKDLLVN
jgi:polyferredoxin